METFFVFYLKMKLQDLDYKMKQINLVNAGVSRQVFNRINTSVVSFIYIVLLKNRRASLKFFTIKCTYNSYIIRFPVFFIAGSQYAAHRMKIMSATISLLEEGFSGLF